MDADDMCRPDRFERQLHFLALNPDVHGVGCAMLILDGRGRPVGVRTPPETHQEICVNAPRKIDIYHATFVGRTAWWYHNPYNPKNDLSEDFELWLSTFRRSTFANLSDALYYYREFDSFQLSKYVRAKRSQARVICRKRRVCSCSAPRSVIAAGRHLLDAAIYSAAACVGLNRALVSTRSAPVDRTDAERFDGALAVIRSTDVFAERR
jgi:hypothetical protein